MRRRFSWRSIWGSILISVGLVMWIIFIFLMDWFRWWRLDPEHQLGMFAIPSVACVFIVFGIRFSIIGLIEEFHIRSPPPISPQMMMNMHNNDSVPPDLMFGECIKCNRGIPGDSNVCCYCGEKIT